uniref:Putative secreted protein n=1 Tax=Amblyomma triste TaxID=251400 RepID=A0A023G5L6_AMBTT
MKLVAFAIIVSGALCNDDPNTLVKEETSSLPDFKYAFFAGIKYGVDLQDIYSNETTLKEQCIFFQRQRPEKDTLKIQFWNGEKEITSTARLAFSSSSVSTETSDQMYISEVADQGLVWLETQRDPYTLLFADGKKCMVVQLPRDLVPEDTDRAQEQPDGPHDAKYCVMLVASDTLQANEDIHTCITFLQANCAVRGHFSRVKNDKCFSAFLPHASQQNDKHCTCSCWE